MNKIPYLLSLISVSILLLSCEKTEKIENFPMSPSKLVLNCQLSPDSNINVLLSKSLSVLDNAPNKTISNAKVDLYIDNILITSLPAANNGLVYTFNEIKPETDHVYKLVATASGFEQVTAEATLPKAVIPDKISTLVQDTTSWMNYYSEWYFETRGKVSVKITDPVGIENFYTIRVFTTDTSYYYDENGDSIMYVNINALYDYHNSTNSPIIDFDYGFSHYFTDQFFDGSQVTIDIPVMVTGNSRSKMITVQLVAISKEQYLYDKSIMIYNNNSGNPFSEPIQIYTNINQGFGIFSGINGTFQTVKFN